jgi:hypothetical protein
MAPVETWKTAFFDSPWRWAHPKKNVSNNKIGKNGARIFMVAPYICFKIFSTQL